MFPQRVTLRDVVSFAVLVAATAAAPRPLQPRLFAAQQWWILFREQCFLPALVPPLRQEPEG